MRVALFCWGSPYDIISAYGVSHTVILYSVWCVVDAVNQLPEFHIEYPRSLAEQQKIANGFEDKSEVGFTNCAGCIDGLFNLHKGPGVTSYVAKGWLVSQSEPSPDVRGRMLDFSIVYGGALSDCLAFEGSGIYKDLEAGLLHEDLVLFGDNAYLNSHYMMVTLFPYVSSGSKDDFNFFHSQLHIHVECAFGMLVFWWGILRSAIPHNISISKTIALVHALAKLHNFCIDEEKDDNFGGDYTVTDVMQNDENYMMMQDQGYILMNVNDTGERIPLSLVDGSHHLDDMPRSVQRNWSRVDDIVGGVN
ncbi:hypothetical protein ACHAW5_002978 [Stephanodiscus triporus]|uniref:DDE Tnp4 domain-containing protein n=1 Tax=Stephanodiscus triporus TaxID=2934178 RepID=A0ABD3PFS2_9STRA